MRRPLRVAFVVQGEGRGHMTQALALGAMLRDAGHQVGPVLLGRSPYRATPEYFEAGIGAEVVPFDAPVQVPDRERMGVSPTATMADVLRRCPAFLSGARLIHRRTAQADVVVNFLDLVGAFSRVLFRTRNPAVAVAHNHIFAIPGSRGLPGTPIGRWAVTAWARATAVRSETRVALSFGPWDGPSGDVLVLPPLLRTELKELRATAGEYLLAYALNPGYGNVLARWQARRPEVEVRCFVEGGAEAVTALKGSGFSAHDLDAEGFLRQLAGCRAYVGSAGFESLCEAHFFGKPVLAVPTRGQLEQALNAWDAERFEVARAGEYEDLDDFWARPPTPDGAAVAAFRTWVRRGPELHLRVIEEVAYRGLGP